MDGRIDAHRHLVRIFVRDPLIHFEQIAVALSNDVLAQTPDRIGEIEIDAQSGLAHAAAFIAYGFGIARRHIARHQIAEARITALQIIIAFVFRNLIRRRLSPSSCGTQMRPSLRSDSLIKVSFD